MNSVTASRLPTLTNDYPRLAKPRLGLNSDRCSAARWMFTSDVEWLQLDRHDRFWSLRCAAIIGYSPALRWVNYL